MFDENRTNTIKRKVDRIEILKFSVMIKEKHGVENNKKDYKSFILNSIILKYTNKTTLLNEVIFF